MTIRVRRTKIDCGNWSGDQPDKPLVNRPYTRVFEAVENGQRIGCIRIDDTGEGVKPFWSWVHAAHRRRGIGTKLYEAAARGACKVFKQPLSSDNDLSDYSRGFWEKQLRKGRATCLLEDGDRCEAFELTCPAPESLAAPPHLEPKIQAAERELVKWKQERGVLFDEDGRVVLQKKGTKTRLKFTEDDVALFPNRYFTHNHPPEEFGTFVAGSSLSTSDVYTAARRNLAEVRAVSTIPVDGRDRVVIYRMERPIEGWPNADVIRDHAEMVSKRLHRRLRADWQAKRRTHQDVAVAVMHETWLELAPKYGFKYDRILLDGAELGRGGGRRRRRRVHSR